MNSLRASTPALKIRSHILFHHDMKLETLYEPAAGADRQVEQEGDGGVERALQPRPALQTVAALLAHNYLEGNSGHMNQCHVRGAWWRILENQNKFEILILILRFVTFWPRLQMHSSLLIFLSALASPATSASAVLLLLIELLLVKFTTCALGASRAWNLDALIVALANLQTAMAEITLHTISKF